MSEIRSLWEYTLEELVHKMGNIQPKDLGTVDGVGMGLTWNQIIQATNYAAGERVLSWKSTALEAITQLGNFLGKGKQST